MRASLFAAFVILCGPLRAAENELPKQAAKPGEPAAQELFRHEGGDVLFPGMNLSDATFLGRIETPSVERAQTTFEQAQRKEQRWQKLGKAGVLAQVEVERATLQTARARARLGQARVAQQQTELTALKARTEPVPAETIAAAESAIVTARTMAAEAGDSLRRTELLLAEANVDRQRRLLKMGAGSKSGLQRAEATLTQLRTPAP